MSKPSCQLGLNHNRCLKGKKSHLWSLYVEHMLHDTMSSCNGDAHWYPHVWLIKVASSKPGASKSRMMTQLTFLFHYKTKTKTGGSNAKPLNLNPKLIHFSWLQVVEHKIQMQMLPQLPQTNIFTCAEAKRSSWLQLCERDCVMSSRAREPLPVLAVLLWELCTEGRLHPPAHRWRGLILLQHFLANIST